MYVPCLLSILLMMSFVLFNVLEKRVDNPYAILKVKEFAFL